MDIIKIIVWCISVYFAAGIIFTLICVSVVGSAYSHERHVSFVNGVIAVCKALGFDGLLCLIFLWAIDWVCSMRRVITKHNNYVTYSADIAEMVDAILAKSN